MSPRDRLIDVRLDETSLGAASPEAEHERRIAIFDLLEKNAFQVVGTDLGPYALTLAMAEQRLVLDVARADPREPVHVFMLSLTPLRRVIRDYFLICDSYHSAIRSASPQQIEAIDMGRRGLHNEGADTLRERLAGKVAMDEDTARRLFTLVCALHVRG